MTPQQRMEVIRWMLDTIERIVEKSEPPALIPNIYTNTSPPFHGVIAKDEADWSTP